MKNKVIRVKNHVVRHRGIYGIALGLTVGAVAVHRAVQPFNEFLAEHNLSDQFYAGE